MNLKFRVDEAMAAGAILALILAFTTVLPAVSSAAEAETEAKTESKTEAPAEPKAKEEPPYRPDSKFSGQPVKPISPPGGVVMAVYKTVGDEQIKLWVDLPKGDGPFPVVIYIHGGGWTSAMWQGESTLFEQHSARMARLGVAGVRIFFRGKQTATIKDTMEDVMDSIEWIRQNAEKYNFDLTRLGTVGASSGGQLAAMAAQLAPECVCIIGISGVYDLPRLFAEWDERQKDTGPKDPRGSSHPGGPWYWGDEENVLKYSPFHHLRPSPPKTLLMHGTADTAVTYEYSLDFAEKVRAEGGEAEVKLFEGVTHGFFNVKRPYYEPAMKVIEKFLVKAFGIQLD